MPNKERGEEPISSLYQSGSGTELDVFQISKEQLREKIQLASTGYNVPYKSSVMFESLSKEEFAKIAPLLSKVEAVQGKSKTDRGYPLKTGAQYCAPSCLVHRL